MAPLLAYQPMLQIDIHIKNMNKKGFKWQQKNGEWQYESQND